VFGIFDVFAEGEQAEKFVPAGDATESRNTEGAPKWSTKAIGEFAGEALNFNVAADGAVRSEQVGERGSARTETIGTSRTTPGDAAEDTGEVVEKSSSARPAALGRITDWTNHWDRASPGPGKSLRYAMGNYPGKQGPNCPAGARTFRVCAKILTGEIMADYTDEHARAGIQAKLPKLDTWPNQYPGYVITTRYPEYTSVCPKTGLPDFGTLTIEYMPRKSCVELKALKMYLLAYRSLGIFYENAVNKILEDIVEAIRPEWCVIRGEFTPRGGLDTTVEARWPRPRGKARK
jgi:7-cyano-7-deazaguanine reductase